MVIYNLSSIFDRTTGERQIVFLTSKVSLVSLAKLDFRVERTPSCIKIRGEEVALPSLSI